MKINLEGIKPLDADVERNGAKEIQYKDSYAYLFDDDDLGRTEPAESDAIARAVAESELDDEELAGLAELWDSSDLGQYTIGTPTEAKQAAHEQESHMKPVSELEFQEISDDLDPESEEMNRIFEEVFNELEGIF